MIIAGNGGSAAMASHVCVDFTKQGGIRSVNFNEADLITCFANDYGYEHWVAKAIEFYGNKGDLAILISSSGNSKNMINGAQTANNLGIDVVTFTGFNIDNPLIINTIPSNASINWKDLINKVSNNVCAAMDLNYNFKVTEFLNSFNSNVKTKNGLDMLIYQALMSLDIWYEKDLSNSINVNDLKSNIEEMYYE